MLFNDDDGDVVVAMVAVANDKIQDSQRDSSDSFRKSWPETQQRSENPSPRLRAVENRTRDLLEFKLTHPSRHIQLLFTAYKSRLVILFPVMCICKLSESVVPKQTARSLAEDRTVS